MLCRVELGGGHDLSIRGGSSTRAMLRRGASAICRSRRPPSLADPARRSACRGRPAPCWRCDVTETSGPARTVADPGAATSRPRAARGALAGPLGRGRGEFGTRPRGRHCRRPSITCRTRHLRGCLRSCTRPRRPGGATPARTRPARAIRQYSGCSSPAEIAVPVGPTPRAPGPLGTVDGSPTSSSRRDRHADLDHRTRARPGCPARRAGDRLPAVYLESPPEPTRPGALCQGFNPTRMPTVLRGHSKTPGGALGLDAAPLEAVGAAGSGWAACSPWTTPDTAALMKRRSPSRTAIGAVGSGRPATGLLDNCAGSRCRWSRVSP